MHIDPSIYMPVWLVALLAVVAVFAAVRGYRTGRMSTGVRTGCRILRTAWLLLLIGGLLNPYILRITPPDRGGRNVAVVVDNSASMGVLEGASTRMERTVANVDAVLGALELPPGSRINAHTFNDVLMPADRLDGSLSCEGGTRMYQSLTSLLHSPTGGRIAAVLLVSDGVSPLDRAESASVIRQYRLRGIPISVLQAASQRYLTDIRITEVAAPVRVKEDEQARVIVAIESIGCAGTSVPLIILRAGREVLRRNVILEGGLQQVALSLPPRAAGEYFFTAQVRTPASDASVDNNSRAFGYRVMKEAVRVLYMEGSPDMRWRALKDALELDEAFEVKALHCIPTSSPLSPYFVNRVYQHPGSTDKVYHVCHPTGGYPRTMKELLEYDVVIISDIPKVCFSAAQMEATLRFVEEFGGGFVMIGGSTAFGQGGYNTSPIEKIIPVAMEVERDELWRRFRLTFPEGIFEHPLMAIGDGERSAEEIWTRLLPPFEGQNRVDRTKPGATLLAANATYRNRWGKLVVLACQETGRGRSLAFTSDTTPDWGTLFERNWGEWKDGRNDQRYYVRFWQNAMRWLGAARIGIPVQRVMPEALPLAWQEGSRQEFRAAVYDAEMNPLTTGDLGLVFTGDDTRHRVSIPHITGSGVCSGWISAPAPGVYRLTAILGEDTDEAYRQDLGRVHIEGANVEMQVLGGDDDALAALAHGTGGIVVKMDEPSAFAARVEQAMAARRRAPEPRPYYFWHSWYTFAILLGLIGAEWYTRRRAGLA